MNKKLCIIVSIFVFILILAGCTTSKITTCTCSKPKIIDITKDIQISDPSDLDNFNYIIYECDIPEKSYLENVVMHDDTLYFSVTYIKEFAQCPHRMKLFCQKLDEEDSYLIFDSDQVEDACLISNYNLYANDDGLFFLIPTAEGFNVYNYSPCTDTTQQIKKYSSANTLCPISFSLGANYLCWDESTIIDNIKLSNVVVYDTKNKSLSTIDSNVSKLSTVHIKDNFLSYRKQFEDQYNIVTVDLLTNKLIYDVKLNQKNISYVFSNGKHLIWKNNRAINILDPKNRSIKTFPCGHNPILLFSLDIVKDNIYISTAENGFYILNLNNYNLHEAKFLNTVMDENDIRQVTFLNNEIYVSGSNKVLIVNKNRN